jgi:YHS domain-containing protein
MLALPMKALHSVVFAAVFAAVLLFAGCASVPEPPSGCANCPVCQHQADLACVCVKIGENTPSCEWNDRTWYFCSEECKKAFLADPRHFMATATK